MILYLGLDPKHFTRRSSVLHYPVIRTEKIGVFDFEVQLAWTECTHVIFTSKRAVSYWWEEHSSDGKIVIAIGTKTAGLLKEKGCDPLVSEIETQEGLIAFLESMDLKNPYFFLPRSKKSRPHLTNFLAKRKWRYFAFDLYDTMFQKPLPVPSLDLFEEIVFTSPSTVHGFLKIFGALPKQKKLTAIGPVTEEVLRSFLEKC